MRTLTGLIVVIALVAAGLAAVAGAQDVEILARAADILRQQGLPADGAQLDVLMRFLGEGKSRGLDVSSYAAMAPGLIKAGAAKLRGMNRESAAAELEALANAFR